MKKKGRAMFIVSFLAPAFILFIIFILVPVLMTVYGGFTDWKGFDMPKLKGLDNYVQIINDELFWIALRNTITWIASSLLIQLPLAAITAIILTKKILGWKFFRTVLFFPALVSLVAVAIMWRSGIYDYSMGLLNMFLTSIGLENLVTDWLGGFDTSWFSVLATFLFYPGFYTIIIMAKLQSVPASLYESAEIDGASKIKQDIYITLPFMRTVYMTCVVLAVTGGLKAFDQIYVLTQGGPGGVASNLPYYIYLQVNTMFNGGVASAVGTVLLFFGIIVVMIVNSISNKLEIEG